MKKYINSDKYSYIKIMFPPLITLLSFVYLIFAVFIPSYQKNIIEDKKFYIQRSCDFALSIIETQYDVFMKGKISENDAKKEAIRHIRAMSFSQKDNMSFFIIDNTPRMIMYPKNEAIEGMNLSDFKDEKGVNLFSHFVKLSNNGGGYFENFYNFRVGNRRNIPKITYVKGFKPWGWIVGSNIYLEDVCGEIKTLTDRLLVICLAILFLVFVMSFYIIWVGILSERKRKKILNSLVENEGKFRALTEKITDITLIFDEHNRIKYINPFPLKDLGYKKEDLLMKDLYSFVHPEDFEKVEKILKQAILIPNKSLFIDNIRIKDRYDKWHILEGSYICLYDNPGIKGIVFSGRDITAKVKLANMMAEQSLRCRRIFESASEGILIVSVETKKLKHFNPAICKMLGYSSDEMYKMTIYDIHPKDKINFVLSEFEAQVKKEKSLAKDVPCLRKNGEIIYADVTAYPLFVGREMCNVGFFTDITEYKLINEELEKYRKHLETLVEEKSRQLIMSEKLSITGRLAAGMAHEINNPLQGMMANLEVLKDYLIKNKESSRCYDFIESNINRIKEIIDHMFDLYRASEGRKKNSNINHLVNKVVSFLESQAHSRNIKLDVNLYQKIPKVKVFEQQIYQVLLNLILNAIESSNEGSKIVVSTYIKNGNINISIEDEGKGIYKKHIEKIFEPFFSIDKEGGRGLGLFICKGLVDNHGGTITVESIKGKGTKFIVILPV